jgi:NADH-quinone oxidoreductase subunit N
MLFYLPVYAVATIGTFAGLASLGGRAREVEQVEDLAGAGRARPLVGLAMAVFLFSLAGVPPLAGFWGKFLLFASALTVDGPAQVLSPVARAFLVLAIVAAANAAVAAAYYLRLVAVMYFGAPHQPPTAGGQGEAASRGAWWATMACAAIVVTLGLSPAGLQHEAQRAGRAARQTAGHSLADTAAGVPPQGR